MRTVVQVARTAVSQNDEIEKSVWDSAGRGKEVGWCFEFDQLGDRRVVDEEGRYVVVMGVKTVVANKGTCLLSERTARRVEDGVRRRRGEGCLVVKANGRQRLCHTLSLIWQLPISSPSIDCPEHSTTQTKFFFFFLVFRGANLGKKNNNPLKMSRSTQLRVLYTTGSKVECGSKGKNWMVVWAGTRAPGAKMRDPCGPCAPKILEGRATEGE